MSRYTQIKLHKEYMKFSAAHFTIFSATERERLHGHNFQVEAEIKTSVNEDGICFGYRLFKDLVSKACKQLDEYVLLPALSPHLDIREEGNYYAATFNGETILQLKSDTLLLPIHNSTVEEFSHYILSQLQTELIKPPYSAEWIRVGVSSGPGQSGVSEWSQQ